MAEDNGPVTLEAIRRVVREELDLRLLRTEQEIRELKAAVRRHDTRFNLLDERLSGMDERLGGMDDWFRRFDDSVRAIRERLGAVEEALDIEAAATGGTLGERLERCEKQIAAINEKLKAG